MFRSINFTSSLGNFFFAVEMRLETFEGLTRIENLANMTRKNSWNFLYGIFNLFRILRAGILEMTEIFMVSMRLQITMRSSHSFWWELFYAGGVYVACKIVDYFDIILTNVKPCKRISASFVLFHRRLSILLEARRRDIFSEEWNFMHP